MQFDFEYYHSLPPGAVAFGRYRVIRYLGSGATGVVYSCRNLYRVEEIVALKVLKKDASEDAGLLARFRNEIHSSYKVSHPNVARGFETFRNEGCDAFTMECVEGGTLSGFIEIVDPAPIYVVVQLLEQLAAGLVAIHKAGLIHRDLKPENILMTQTGVPKISDFGTAIASEARGEDLGAIGTLQYMSPEVLADGWADELSDIFGLGAIAYEMIVGLAPFSDEEKALSRQLRERRKLISPRKIRPECPKELSEFVMRALSYDRRRRFQSASEMREALLALNEAKKPSLLGRLFG